LQLGPHDSKKNIQRAMQAIHENEKVWDGVAVGPDGGRVASRVETQSELGQHNVKCAPSIHKSLWETASGRVLI